MPSRGPGRTATWTLTALTALQLVGLVGTWWFFVRTAAGQALDTASFPLDGPGRYQMSPGLSRHIGTAVEVTVALLGLVAAVTAAVQRRYRLLIVTVLFIATSNLTVQVLKSWLYRPHLVDDHAILPLNTLPSGHTAGAATVAVAVLWVLPPRWRRPAAPLAACYMAVVAMLTLITGWHRASDPIASLLLVGLFATVAVATLTVWEQPGIPRPPAAPAGAPAEPDVEPVITLALAFVGVLLAVTAFLVAGAILAMGGTSPEQLHAHGRNLAFLGALAGIAGTATVMTASVFATTGLADNAFLTGGEGIPSAGRPR